MFDADIELPSKWIKLKDGEPVTGFFLGEPAHGYAAYDPAQGMVKCPKEDGGKFRFVVAFWDGESCKSLEGGISLYRELKELAKDVDLSCQRIKITRTGSGASTKYKVTPLGAVSDEEKESADQKAWDVIDETKWLKTDGIPF